MYKYFTGKPKIAILAMLLLMVFSKTAAKDDLLFKPLTANVFEPRIGTLYQNNTEKVRLDIGHSFDLYRFSAFDSTKFSIGCDFFTFTRLRTAGNFKFPVEAADYLFGVNASTSTKAFDHKLDVRLRIAHISAHLVDGMAIDTILSRSPFVYSREFIDLCAAMSFDPVRIYAGCNLMFHTIPSDPLALTPQLGFDFEQGLSGDFYISGGYDFKLVGMDGTRFGVNAAQCGIEWKTFGNVGLFLGFYLYEGKSMHGMFYNEHDSYTGIGFQVNY